MKSIRNVWEIESQSQKHKQQNKRIYSPGKYWKSIWCRWCSGCARFKAIEAILVVDKLQIKCPSERIILHFGGIRLFTHVIGVGRCTQRVYCTITTQRTFIECSLIVEFESLIDMRERQVSKSCCWINSAFSVWFVPLFEIRLLVCFRGVRFPIKVW